MSVAATAKARKPIDVTVNPRMGRVEWLLLIALSMLWGGSFFFGEVALRDLQPFTLVLGRVSIAALALNILVRMHRYRMPGDLRSWLPFFAMGTLNNLVPFSLIFWGQTEIASGLAAILNATTPIFTIILAHVLTADERLTLRKATGALLGIVGVCVLVGPAAASGIGLNFLAQLAVLGAALSYAFAGIYGRRFRGTPPLVTAAGQVTATTVLMVPIALFVDQPWTGATPDLATIGSLAGLGLLSTALAYIIYFRILATAGATNLLLVTFLIPVSALFLGFVVLGESLSSSQFAGMAVIAVGLLAIDGRLLDLPIRAGIRNAAGRGSRDQSMDCSLLQRGERPAQAEEEGQTG